MRKVIRRESKGSSDIKVFDSQGVKVLGFLKRDGSSWQAFDANKDYLGSFESRAQADTFVSSRYEIERIDYGEDETDYDDE